MAGAPLPFRKMNGLGNAFAVFDARERPVSLPPDAIRALGEDGAIGFDQMITLERSPKNAGASPSAPSEKSSSAVGIGWE